MWYKWHYASRQLHSCWIGEDHVAMWIKYDDRVEMLYWKSKRNGIQIQGREWELVYTKIKKWDYMVPVVWHLVLFRIPYGCGKKMNTVTLIWYYTKGNELSIKVDTEIETDLTNCDWLAENINYYPEKRAAEMSNI